MKQSTNRNFCETAHPSSLIPHPSNKGFTLVEILVVISIIAILIGVSVGGYSSITKTAEKTKAQELVSNTATALTALFQQRGSWPKVLIDNDGKQLDAKTAYALVAGSTKYFSLSESDGKLIGLDRCGIVSPWATTALKRAGTGGSEATPVGNKTVKDHILYYALDLDGDGIIENAPVGNSAVSIRATAAVWCCGKDGVVDPYPYASGGGDKGKNTAGVSGKTDDVYSWTVGQTRGVK